MIRYLLGLGARHSWFLRSLSSNSAFLEVGGTASPERKCLTPPPLSSLIIAYYFRSVQIIFFTVIASKVKENANGARTFLEIVKARFGMSAHIMFTVCQNLVLNVSNIITNFFKSSTRFSHR